MYRAIVALTQRRQIRVKAGAGLSEKHVLDMGVPQGAILAPLLFSIMISDIKEIPLLNSQIVLYADDLTIWSTVQYKKFSDRTIKSIQKKFQADIDKVVSYMDNNGFLLSPEKTALVFFPARHRVDVTKFKISIYNSTVTATTSTRYLGVIFDHSLSWGPHVQHLLSKASRAIGLIRTLKHVKGCNNVQAMLCVTRALIRSRLSYGQEAFFAAPRTTLCKLQAKECAILRIVLGLPKNAPQELVYREAGWLPLDRERELRCAQYIARSKAVENSTSDEVQLNFDDANSESNISLRRHKHTIAERNLSIANYAERVNAAAGVADCSIAQMPVCPVPPWLLKQATVFLDYSPITKKDQPLLLTTHAKEFMHDHLEHHLKIFTDGSKQTSGHVGCAFTIPSLNISKGFRLNNDVSIFSSELFAIYMALSYVSEFPDLDPKIAILTDSKSALQALQGEGGGRGDLVLECRLAIDRLITRGSDVALVWIPSHTGIKGNDAADAAAKAASSLPAVTNDIGYTVSEVCSKLRSAVTSLYAVEFKTLATERNWFDSQIYNEGVRPNIPFYLLPLFYRLRSQSLLFNYIRNFCSCKAPLTFNHIFSCKDLIPTFVGLGSFRPLNPTCPTTFLCKHPVHGWKLAATFCKELSSSKIGHLL
jgi:ribonuclease HI